MVHSEDLIECLCSTSFGWLWVSKEEVLWVKPFLAEMYTIFHITSYGMAVDQLFTMCMLCLCKMCVLIRVHLISVPTALAVYHFPLEPCVLCDVLH